MTDEEVKLLKTLPADWQIAILDRKIARYQEMVDFVPKERVSCATPGIWNAEILERLKALRAIL